VPADWQGRHIVLRFEGVNRHSRTWVNGQDVGRNDNSYLRFEHDVSHALDFGAENVVALQVFGVELLVC